MSGLIEILSRYKFTVEENTPLEEEVALDPELLGKYFGTNVDAIHVEPDGFYYLLKMFNPKPIP